MLASVIFKDNDANGDVTVSVKKAPDGAEINVVAVWIYERAQFFSGAEGQKHFCDPDGAMGDCRIDLDGTGGGVRLSLVFGGEGASDEFYPLSHQLACLLFEEVALKLAATAGAAAAATRH